MFDDFLVKNTVYVWFRLTLDISLSIRLCRISIAWQIKSLSLQSIRLSTLTNNLLN